MPESPGVIPENVLDALALQAGRATARSQWRIEALGGTWPVFRVTVGDASFIVKKSDQPARAVLVSQLFTALALPGAKVLPLIDDWLCLSDMGFATAENMLKSSVTIDQLRGWMPGLGGAAAQADLVAMRDRNLGNLLLQGDGATFVHIDYEAAFNAGLFDRAMRPIRTLRYLLRRLFFDVIDAARVQAEGEMKSLLARFADGFRAMQATIDRALAGKPNLPAMTWKQRLYLRTRLRDTPRSSQLLRDAFDVECRRAKER